MPNSLFITNFQENLKQLEEGFYNHIQRLILLTYESIPAFLQIPYSYLAVI